MYFLRKYSDLFSEVPYVAPVNFMFNLADNIEELGSSSQLTWYFMKYQKYLVIIICFRLLK